MSVRRIRSGCFALAIAFLVAASARANTYVVGPGPRADFPDIPSAIAGSQPGDVLLVQAGAYSGGFTLDKGLTILGTTPVSLSGAAQIASVPAGQRAVVVNLSVAGIVVDQCEGPVVLQQITSGQAMTVSASADVRCRSITVDPPGLPTTDAVSVTDSRLEIVSSNLGGGDDPPCCGTASGGLGLSCGTGSRVHVVTSDVRGGRGQDASDLDVSAGNGGAGILTDAASELILSGTGPSPVWTGEPGFNWAYQVCCWDGEGTYAVQNQGPVWSSGVTFHPGSWHATSPPVNESMCCQVFGDYSDHGGSGAWTDVTPDDPSLSITGTPTNGASVTLTITGPVGARAWLELGRRIAVVPDPNTRIEEFVDPASTLDLGTIPASGQASFSFGLPGFVGTHRYLHLPPGAFFAAQGLVTLPTGEMRRTNSIPIVGR